MPGPEGLLGPVQGLLQQGLRLPRPALVQGDPTQVLHGAQGVRMALAQGPATGLERIGEGLLGGIQLAHAALDPAQVVQALDGQGVVRPEEVLRQAQDLFADVQRALQVTLLRPHVQLAPHALAGLHGRGDPVVVRQRRGRVDPFADPGGSLRSDLLDPLAAVAGGIGIALHHGGIDRPAQSLRRLLGTIHLQGQQGPVGQQDRVVRRVLQCSVVAGQGHFPVTGLDQRRDLLRGPGRPAFAARPRAGHPGAARQQQCRQHEARTGPHGAKPHVGVPHRCGPCMPAEDQSPADSRTTEQYAA